MDRHGNRYFDSGNPAIGDASRDRAREEDLVKEILDKLDWIKGVRVQVKVNSPRIGVSPAGAVSLRQPVAPTGRHHQDREFGSSRNLTNSMPAMSVNQVVIA